jgi:hypothetical protein
MEGLSSEPESLSRRLALNRLKDYNLTGLLRLINKALGIIEVPDAFGSGDAGAHAHGNHVGLQPVTI